MIPHADLPAKDRSRLVDEFPANDHQQSIETFVTRRGYTSFATFADDHEMSYLEMALFSKLTDVDQNVLVEACKRHWGEGKMPPDNEVKLGTYLRKHRVCTYQQLAEIYKGASTFGGKKCIESFQDMTDMLASDPRPGEDRIYYRGEPALWPKMVSSLSRDFNKLSKVYGGERNRKLLQEKLLQRLQRYTSQYHYEAGFDNHIDNILEWMCVAQHHRLPTFLIDWSLNPMIGLYFATELYGDTECDARIWFMRLRERNQRLKTTLYVDIRPEGYASKDETSPVDLAVKGNTFTKSALIVVPRVLTRRIDVQSGRFILYPVDQEASGLYQFYQTNKDDVELCPWSQMEYYIIPNYARKRIEQQLSTFRIHRGSVYADLDSYATYIGKGNL